MKNTTYLFVFGLLLLLVGCIRTTKSYEVTVACHFLSMNPNFEEALWKKDQAGQLGHRLKYFNTDTCTLRLKKGMSKVCIVKHLGPPHKIHLDDLEYLIDEESMSLILYFEGDYYKRSNLLLQ